MPVVAVLLFLRADIGEMPTTLQAPLVLGSPRSSDSIPHRDTTRDYLGQRRPGAAPVLFAEGLVSTTDGMYGTIVFSPRQDEAFWAKDKRPELFFTRLVAGRWSAPSEFPFREHYRLSSPFFSADGERLYFLAAHHGASGLDEDERIWVVDRSSDGWGEPRELDTLVNSVPDIHWQFSVNEKGDVYFGGEGADLYVAEFQDGRYSRPVRLPPPINTDAPETGPTISRDGRLLLFDRWFDSSPYIRIMVSFRSRTGTWSEPIDLSPYTRAEGSDMAARLSPDEKYLLFQSQRAGSDPNRSVYWMKADFLDGLRQQAKWENP
jgi:hypothetical protein